MKPRWLFALLLPVCLVSVALADDKADLADLEKSSWKVININQAGKDAPKEIVAAADVRFTFKGDKLTLKSAGESKEGTFKIDSAKKPKEMELKMEKDMDKAIYEIEKDTLKIAINKKELAKDFKGGPDTIVFTLERVK